MKCKTITLLICVAAAGCSLPENRQPGSKHTAMTPKTGDSAAARNIGHIPLPAGFRRVRVAEGSFGDYLRQVPLKKTKTVRLFNGQPKLNQEAHYAILDIPVGTQDLQQCADAVMRLKAEYLFGRGLYDRIVFYDNVGGVYAFRPPFTRARFDAYLQRVFGMCGSASLEKEMQPVRDFSQIMPGDVLVKGGFPGHAEIVTDVAVNADGEKIYMLAQSYMPAQDIHIVKNPLNDDLSPWYEASNETGLIITPEYSFYASQLRRWNGMN